VTAALEIPFCDSEGRHRMTLPVEVGDLGEPPETVELIGPDEDGRTMRWCYRREHRPETEPRWAYVETGRVPSGVPRPGSEEALFRLMRSREWPG